MRSKKDFEVHEKYTILEMAKYMRDLYSDKDCYEYEVLTKAIELFEGEPRYTLKEANEIIADAFMDLMNPGVPRYSIAELEKLNEYWYNGRPMKLDTEDWGGVCSFIDLLKDRVRVEAILK